MPRSSRFAAARALALSAAVLVPLCQPPAAVAESPGSSPSAGLELTPLGTHETGVFDESAAEIPAYDPDSERLFVVNAHAGRLDVLRIADNGAPRAETTLAATGLPAEDGSTTDAGATANSAAVSGGVLAVAVEPADKTERGWVMFFDAATLRHLGGVRVGTLPDSLAFTPNGSHVIVANEGEPAEDYTVDPEGTVSVIDVPRSIQQFDRLDQSAVRTVDFRAYDEGTPLPEGVRVFGPDVPVPDGHEEAGRVARNLEPEFVSVDPTGRTAYVSLQEADAIAAVDVRAAELTDLWPLTDTDWSVDGRLDPSNKDGSIHRAHHPVSGVPMPDGIDVYRHRGQDVIVTANEGDGREWGEFTDAERVKELQLCQDAFDDVEALQQNAALGRLHVLTDLGVRAGENCHESLYALGGRSFSIYTAEGERLFDSAGMIEAQIERLIEAGELPEHAFNANNDETPSGDSRSDDKGPEPEDVVIGEVTGRTYAFVGLERVGGVMVFDITDPRNASYVDYVNGRDWDAAGEDGDAGLGDMGAEGLQFVSGSDSPTGQPLLIVANEVSGSTTVYGVGTPDRR